MARPAALVLSSLALVGAVATGAVSSSRLQPPSGGGGLELEIRQGRAWLARPNGQRLRLPVRGGETLEEMVEFEDGWAAAGVRDRESRRELVVILDGSAGVERLRAVPEPTAAHRLAPVPIASSSGFAGLAWLEGDSPDRNEVKAAAWTGADWSPPETVSPALSGGQAGLSGLVLDDDRWLLVWSGSEGRGSELLWSLREEGHWSPPARLAAANRVPDITPTLIRARGGALVVWARRRAGGYQLQAARFDGAWSAPRTLGPVGASFPRFAELTGVGRFLLFRSPAGWTTLELDAAGGELRRAEVESPMREQPVLSAAGGGLSLRWGRGVAPQALRWERSP